MSNSLEVEVGEVAVIVCLHISYLGNAHGLGVPRLPRPLPLHLYCNTKIDLTKFHLRD
jgi:hypothetical protein